MSYYEDSDVWMRGLHIIMDKEEQIQSRVRNYYMRVGLGVPDEMHTAAIQPATPSTDSDTNMTVDSEDTATSGRDDATPLEEDVASSSKSQGKKSKKLSEKLRKDKAQGVKQSKKKAGKAKQVEK